MWGNLVTGDSEKDEDLTDVSFEELVWEQFIFWSLELFNMYFEYLHLIKNFFKFLPNGPIANFLLNSTTEKSLKTWVGLLPRWSYCREGAESGVTSLGVLKSVNPHICSDPDEDHLAKCTGNISINFHIHAIQWKLYQHRVALATAQVWKNALSAEICRAIRKDGPKWFGAFYLLANYQSNLKFQIRGCLWEWKESNRL